MKMRKRSAVLAGLALVAVLAVGCGGGSSSDESSGGDSSAVLSKSKKTVEKLLGPKGTYKEPEGGAPKPADGAKIALVSCGQQIEGCAETMAAAEEAASELGWTTTLFDTKGDPTQANTAIRQAIAQNMQGVFTYAIDCEYAKAGLEEAKKAGVPVYQAQGRDCNESDPGAPALFAGSNVYSEGEGWFDYIDRVIRSQVDYAIAKTDADTNVMFLADDTLALSKEAAVSAKDATEACSTCSYTEVIVPITSIGTKLQGQVQQQLLKNPDTNAIVVAYQDLMLGGGSAAVQQSGKQDDILMSTGEGGTASMDLVRSGDGTYFGYGFSAAWEGWAAIDALNRMLAGQEPANSGIGIQLYDAEHNTPESGPYEPPIDFRSAYLKSWGAGS